MESKYSMTANDYINMLENSRGGIMLSDADGNILYMNKAYYEISGFPSDAIGRNLNELIKEGYMLRSAPLIAANEKRVVTLTHSHTGGKIFAFVVSKPIFDENGDVVKVITNASDSTEIVKLKNELIKAEEIVQQYSEELTSSEIDYGKNIVAASSQMKEVFALAKKTCNVDVSVLIRGESGVGKDIVARYIHERGSRKNGPFIAINCGAIPESLLESELFGYVGGAFTGAERGGKVGLFEASNKGTVFLDEIGDVSPNFQVKILRVLENRVITRVGDYKQIPIDVRILAATNKDIESMVEKGTFREDLYYRLNVIKIDIPPLRKRRDDIIPLCLFYLDYFNKFYGLKRKMTPQLLEIMSRFSWPGNIRQLKNAVDRMVILSNGEYITESDFRQMNERGSENIEELILDPNEIIPLNDAVEAAEKEMLKRAKRKYRTTREMAKALKVDHSTVTRKLNKYGI